MNDKDEESVEASVKALERESGIREGLLEGLRKEDDWSFLIKAHAFVEAAMTHVLSAKLGKGELEDIFSQMELSDKRVGKVAFADALGLLGKDERRLLAAFSELRNRLVHRIENVDFNFATYFAGLNPDQQRNFVSAFSYFAGGETFKFNEADFNTADFVREKPRAAVYFSVMVFIAILRIRKGYVGLNELFNAFRRQASKAKPK